ncbi:MAG TPA: ATP synthase F0 subunit B [Thermodesulfobacteriota bacterium]|nr:ATP synthase F0 subunit B [Thermodesulfobacteriota bacterium]
MKANKILPVLSLVTLVFAASSQAFAAEDLLSVNKTVFIQIVIFIAAIFILNTLVFKPFMELIDRRDKLTKGSIKEARELEEKVKQIILEYETKLNEARAQAQEERSKIVREAEAAASGIVAKTREETGALLEEAKKKIESEAEVVKEKLKGDVQLLSKEIASKILGREAGA